MKRPYKLVIGTQRKEMRSLRAQGLTIAAIAERCDRHPETVRYHVHDVQTPTKIRSNKDLLAKRARRLARLDSYFALCNRAIAEAWA